MQDSYCISMERIYVHRSVAERTSPRRWWRAGRDAPFPPSRMECRRRVPHQPQTTRHGHPVTSTTLAPRVRRFLIGGRPRPDVGPFFFEPTVLANVSEDMACFSNETFGPVVSIYPYDTGPRQLNWRTGPITG